MIGATKDGVGSEVENEAAMVTNSAILCEETDIPDFDSCHSIDEVDGSRSSSSKCWRELPIGRCEALFAH